MLEKCFDKEKTCRTCANTGIELSSLFAKQDTLDGVCLSDMIKECIMYTVQEDDELPHLICSDCKDKARIAYDFKKQCEESHRKLLELLTSMKEFTIEVNRNSDEPLEEDKKEEEISEGNNNLRKKSTRRSSKRHPCEKCDQTFAKIEKLREHIKAEHKIPRQNCPVCSKEFIRLGHLTRHLNKVHKKEEVSTENKNSEVFVKSESESVIEPEITLGKPSKADSDMEELNFDFGTDNEDDHSYHGDSESLKSVKTELEANDGKTDNLSTRAEEKEEQEENEKSLMKEEDQTLKKSSNSSSLAFLDSNRRFQCDQCHKAFKRKSHLKQHSLCHTKVKPYQCTICEKKFGRPDNLKVHMSNHGQKHFQCNSCDRSFGQAYLLKRHKDQTHSEEKPFLCSECGQRFVRNGDLAVHMRRHTGEKPYKCQYCNKGFTRSTEVYVHERYHTGEKRHVCSICGKAFQRPYNLLVHVRTHTGERPYQCPHCPKNFAQCSDLKAHIRRHTGERYRCEQCGMGFIHVFVLNQHKLSVHGIEVQSRIKRVAKLSTDTQ